MKLNLSAGRWWLRLRLGPFVLGAGWPGKHWLAVARLADPYEA